MSKEKQSKLHTALIETGKEVEAIKEMPRITDIENEFFQLKWRAEAGDMKGMRRYGRRLAALVIKFMIEKL